MEFSLFNNAAWQLVKQMDFVALTILVGLFGTSVLCIAIIAFKYAAFKRHKISIKNLQKRIKSIKSFHELVALSKEFKNTLGGSVLSESILSVNSLLDTSSQTHDQSERMLAKSSLSAKDMSNLEISVGQVINETILDEEIYLPVLSASASTAPLVGLFGTIWGLIHAFVDISHEKNADITTVAPGMAEALIVTLAGLIVAIPAMIAYFYFSNELRKIEFALGEIGEHILRVTQHSFEK